MKLIMYKTIKISKNRTRKGLYIIVDPRITISWTH